MVSMQATSGNPNLKTMKSIGTKPIFALLYSGSTHSFIDPDEMKFTIKLPARLQMDKHNGDRLKWLSLQGLELTCDLRLLEIKEGV